MRQLKLKRVSRKRTKTFFVFCNILPFNCVLKRIDSYSAVGFLKNCNRSRLLYCIYARSMKLAAFVAGLQN
jgi:hypothetical protein